SPAKPHLQEARKSFDAGEPEEALRHLTSGFIADSAYEPLYELAAECLRQLDSEDAAQLFDTAYTNFKSAESFYRLGCHFVDEQHHQLANAFLERAHKLAPKNLDIALELALSYNSCLEPLKARNLLSGMNLRENFWATYEFMWSSLLCNQFQDVAEFVNNGRKSVMMVNVDEETRSGVLFALNKLEEVQNRLRAFPNPEPLIQHWHFIQYGAAILDYFDNRTADEGLSVAGGRWVAFWASYANILMVLYKLRRYLEVLDRYPLHVAGLEDRDSEIIGRAAAGVLDLPFVFATREIMQEPDVLIVAFDNRQLRFTELQYVEKAQTLFALNLHWLLDAGPTPDVAGVMSQSYSPPWSGDMLRIDPETRKMTRSEPDTRPVVQIVADLLAAEPETDPRFDEIMDFYRIRAEYLKGGSKDTRIRLPFRTDSPIPGSYFS
ncbi:MAG: hypothetical protein JW981_03985, partial [Anaerolineae bacterium]|nr:hypothetical protein [Anaerolineae bacterium]